MLVFLLILLIIFLIIITLKIKIQIINLKFSSRKLNNRFFNKKYKIIITFCTFYRIPLLKFEINEKSIKKLKDNEKIKQKIKKQQQEIKNYINKESFKYLKELRKIRFNIKDIDLKINIGTEDAALTSVIIPTISTILAFFLRKRITKFTNQIFSVQPIYINENMVNISLNLLFELNVILIINALMLINKQKKQINKKYVST